VPGCKSPGISLEDKMKPQLTFPEAAALRVLRLCTAPGNSYFYYGIDQDTDKDGTPYSFLLNKLREKGYVSINGVKNRVRILR